MEDGREKKPLGHPEPEDGSVTRPGAEGCYLRTGPVGDRASGAMADRCTGCRVRSIHSRPAAASCSITRASVLSDLGLAAIRIVSLQTSKTTDGV
jgi:hypothetical protein